jgi:hypothetical protein
MLSHETRSSDERLVRSALGWQCVDMRAGWLLAVLITVGCSGPAARITDQGPNPESELALARAKAEQARTPALELLARRELLHKLLALGWTPEAAREYTRIRELGKGEDPALLRELCLGTLRWALRDIDPARRLRALRTARWLPIPEERLALAKLGLNDARPEVRSQAVSLAASLLPEPRAWELLGTALGDPAPLVREAALCGAASGAEHEASLALALLRRGFQDVRPEVRRVAVIASRRAEGLSAALAPAWAELTQNGDLNVAQEAVLALASTQPKLAAESWEAAHHSGAEARAFGRGLHAVDLELVRTDLRGSLSVRLAAVRGLQGRDPRSRSRVRAALVDRLRTDPAMAVRREAFVALTAIPQGLALRLGRDLLLDPRPEVRILGLQVLVHLDRLSETRARALLGEGDPALVGRLLAWLMERGHNDALLAATTKANTRLAAIETLARQGSAYVSLRGFLDSSAQVERVLALRGLAACGQRKDVPLLVEALGRADEDIPAAIAILAVWERDKASGLPQ